MPTLEEQVRKVIADLGEDDDFIGTVKDEINLGELVRDELENSDQVKEALTSLVLKAIRDYDPDEDSGITEAIQEHLDYDELVKSAMEDEAVRTALLHVVRECAEKFSPEDEDTGGNSLSQRVGDALLTDEKIGEYLDGNDDVLAAVREKVTEIAKETIRDLDDEDVTDRIRDAVVFDDATIKSVCAEPEIQQAITVRARGLITGALEDLELDEDEAKTAMDALDISGAIRRLLQNREEFQTLVDETAENAVKSWLDRASRDTSLFKELLAKNDAFQRRVDVTIDRVLASDEGREYFDGLVKRVLGSREAQDAVLNRLADLMVRRLGDVLFQSATGPSAREPR